MADPSTKNRGERRVVVVGAGVAGVAAAWAAHAGGANVRLFDEGLGASCMAGGAVDDQPWEQVARAADVLQIEPVAGALPDEVVEFARALALWRIVDRGEPLARLATEAGRIRVARGCDAALLDLARLRDGSRVLLPRVPRAEWDADAMARAFNADAYARSRQLSFEAVDCDMLKRVGEDRIAPADLAARHDDRDRRSWLSDHLRELCGRAGRVDALLLGPWLGTEMPRAAEIGELVGVQVGEIVATAGLTAGLRFEAARRRLLERLGTARETSRVAAIARDAKQLVVTCDGDGGDRVPCDAVVLAIGGLVGGGIVFDAPERAAGQEMVDRVLPAFRTSVAADVMLMADGRSIDAGSSVHGPALDRDGWPSDADPGLLERIGIACCWPDRERSPDASRASAVRASPHGIFAAGDAIADRPRTLLQAVWSGACAGDAAAAS